MTEAGLKCRIRDRDPQLIAELMVIIRRTASHFNLIGDSTLDDICHDSFLKLAQNLQTGQFRYESSLKTYVYAVVRNTCIDHYRAFRAAEMLDITEVDVTDEGDGPDSPLLARENRRTACLVLQSLPHECRKLWRAIFFGKLNYRQAAQRLGIAEGTVKRKMWECRQIAGKLVERYEK